MLTVDVGFGTGSVLIVEVVVGTGRVLAVVVGVLPWQSVDS